jgi:hypothetical protein
MDETTQHNLFSLNMRSECLKLMQTIMKPPLYALRLLLEVPGKNIHSDFGLTPYFSFWSEDADYLSNMSCFVFPRNGKNDNTL